MKQQIFEKAPKADRLDMIKERASRTEKQTYVIPATQEELDEQRILCSNNVIERGTLDEEYSEVKKSYREQFKKIDEKIQSSVQVIRHKGFQITGDVYLIPDYKEGKMGIYDPTGRLIFERDLLPSEKQLDLYPKTGTND